MYTVPYESFMPEFNSTHNSEMDWSKLYFGHLRKSEVDSAVHSFEWQQLRIWLKGKSLNIKYFNLMKWLTYNKCSRKAQVQVTNYVTALSRGGLIKPEDYRNKDDKTKEI